MNEAIKLMVDFNSQTPTGRVVLGELSYRELQAQLGSELPLGTPLVLHEDEIEVDAILSYDEQFETWVAIPNWETLRERPDFGSSTGGDRPGRSC